ncbi:polysaccharide deacetylase family protein [Evansella sp. AB-rgal1]|uniref:polysaccharide deacetylase family protein n=1 Tax=Evansella sp. AB-rgal1 TaxID=3242696 RepID=UPI00359EF7E2
MKSKKYFLLFGITFVFLLLSYTILFLPTESKTTIPNEQRVQSLQTNKNEFKEPLELHPTNENSYSNSDEIKVEKKVFITFDDGPSTITPPILELLKKHNVPASFFVVGKNMEENPEIVQRAYNEGHMILTHSYTHDYSIYTSLESFYDDFSKAEEVYHEVLNKEPPNLFRFPGGSSNHSSFAYGGKQLMPKLTRDIKKKGYTYIDWNVSSGDAGPHANDGVSMEESIVEYSEDNNLVVLLFHDTPNNNTTAEILPNIISYYKNQGYQFRSFRDVTESELNKMKHLQIANKIIEHK